MYVEHLMERYALLYTYITHILLLSLSNGLTNNLQVLNSNITLAGIFEIQTKGQDGECGEVQVSSVMNMEAVRWYLQTINDNGSLPFKLGFSVYKTCGIPGRAGDAAVDIISRYRRSVDTDSPEDLIIGVIGPEFSSETQVVSSILGSQTTTDRLLQVGYSSASEEMNDRMKYPNYFSVVVDDKVKIKALLQLMHDLKWNRIAILYVNDTESHARAAMLKDNTAGRQICISRIDAIGIDSKGQIKVAEIRDILDNYVAHIIEGVVYFGPKEIANKVLQIINEPIFILAESTLEADVFQSATGSLFSKTKGTLALSLPYYEASGFKQYWNNIFTDKNALKTASVVNPYLKDVFRKYTGCNFSSASCDALSETEISSRAFQSVTVHYAIYAAHTLVEAVKKFIHITCNSNCDTADKFRAYFKPYHLIKVTDGLSVSFAGMDGSFTKDLTHIRLADGEKEHEVYNFRKDPDDKNTFIFVNVGNMTDGSLELDMNKIKDYRPDGSEISYPNVRRGQCPAGQWCPECIASDFSDINYHILGDFYIIGIVSINNLAIPGPLGCGTVRTRHGYQMYLSMQFALEEFKTRSWYAHYKDMFDGKKIGLIVINSCNNALEVVPKVLELHSKGLRLHNGTYMNLTNRILGYIGGQAAAVSEPVASQLTKLKFVQISYTTTNPVLSNKELYPYFLRIISPDNVQAKAMIDIVKGLRGEYIQLVYSEGAYGEGGRDEILAAASAAKICVVQSIEVKESDTYYEYFELLRKKAHAKIVLVFLRSHIVSPFLRDVNANMKRGDFQFIGSEAWGMNLQVLDYDITQGAIITTAEMDKERDLDDFIRNQKPEYNDSNPWLLDYIQNRQQCYYSWSYDKRFSRECTDDILPISDPKFESDPWCIFVFKTTIAFLKGAAVFYSDQCGATRSNQLCSDFVNKPDQFFKVLTNVKMDVYGTGEILIFDEKGDGLMGYKIYNIQTGKVDKTTRKYSLVGSYSPSAGLQFQKEDIVYPKDHPIISACPNQLACSNCLGDNSTNAKSDEIGQKTVLIVLGVLAGVLAIAVFALGVGFILFLRRKIKVPDNSYITPTYADIRPAAEGAHSESDTSYITANPSFEHD